ncbi:MAG TPA: hypothetical protein DEB39_10910 [Planctomycetaceae bacterium]|nr:hypothetical protein [Planctomycetaceae bacterium]
MIFWGYPGSRVFCAVFYLKTGILKTGKRTIRFAVVSQHCITSRSLMVEWTCEAGTVCPEYAAIGLKWFP